ncbi:Protein of unknown function [Nonomuraea pusilla]|uniref:DUF4031 domain-containing protein n=1 Tax=Nonomuraea pusilla TaxID=46177 RepID=A0A1H8FG23_9ACTN|nr:Protein of unknown function [Nonomuraea pusilla]
MVTGTARVGAAAWKHVFDGLLRGRAARSGAGSGRAVGDGRRPTLGDVTVLIDPPNWPGPRGLMWSHLVSDASLDELHTFALRLGAPARAFDRDHYDVPETAHALAVELGAEAVSSRELLRRLMAAGLRRRKPHLTPR